MSFERSNFKDVDAVSCGVVVHAANMSAAKDRTKNLFKFLNVNNIINSRNI